MKKYIVSILLALSASFSATVSAISLDVSSYQFATAAANADGFGYIGSPSAADAITDMDLSSFIYVPSSSEALSMTATLGFDLAVADQAGTDLSFFFVGGGTSNSIELSIGGTSRVYDSSVVLYTDASQDFIYTAITDVGEYALSAIFVDLSDFGVASMTDMDLTLGKGTYLSMVAADPAPAISPVPVPAAVWLFATGLLAMAGVARRKA